MKQVFQSLSALPDDELAYSTFHKVEAEKRLIGRQQQQQQQALKDRQLKEQQDKEKQRVRELAAKRAAALKNNEKAPPVKPFEPVRPTVEEPFDTGFKCNPERMEVCIFHIFCIYIYFFSYFLNWFNHWSIIIFVLYLFQEIKKILAEMYSIHSPEKVSKIDRLLQKYEVFQYSY